MRSKGSHFGKPIVSRDPVQSKGNSIDTIFPGIMFCFYQCWALAKLIPISMDLYFARKHAAYKKLQPDKYWAMTA